MDQLVNKLFVKYPYNTTQQRKEKKKTLLIDITI